MSPSRKRLILASLLAAAGLAAQAQALAPAAAASAPQAAQRGDFAEFERHRQARHAERLDTLKAKLKLAPAQEAAWSRFSKAMEPAPLPPNRPDRAEWAKLTTPERIDRMQALREQHRERQDQRAEATKTFYASLSAEQKKVFDAETLRGDRHGPWGEEHGMKRRWMH